MSKRGGTTRLAAIGMVAATLWGGGAAVARPPAQPRPAAARTGQAARWRVDHGTVRREPDELAAAIDALRSTPPGSAARAKAVHAAELAGLHRAGFAGPLDDVPDGWSGLVAVGDLDGDGRADTVETTYVGNAAGPATIVRARRGSDGRTLWEMRVAGSAGVIGARVGASGGDGLLVMSLTQQAQESPVAVAAAEDWTLSAYDGHGAQVWTRPLPPDVWGFSLVGGAVVGGPGVAGIGNLLPGRADDVLIQTLSFAFVPTASFDAWPGYVVNGADGTLGPGLAPAVLNNRGGSLSFVVPDLSGDGLDDIVVEAGAGTTTTLVAEQANGTPIWVARDLPVAWLTFVDPLGDVTGDGRGDLAVTVDSSNGQDPESVEVLVLSGADSTVAARYRGHQAIGLGDVDRDGRRDVAVVTYTIDSPRLALTVVAYGRSGKALYRHVEAAGRIENDEDAYGGVADIGDVQGDGVEDLATFLSSRDRRDAAAGREAMLDGRTGRVLHRRLAAAVHASFDGRGDDLLQFSKPNAGTVRLTALAGSTGRVLWSADIRSGASGMFLDTTINRADVDGDRRADLVVSLTDDHGTVNTVLRGRDGKPAWSFRTITRS